MMEVWEAYIRKWAQYPNVIWQIGLRGFGDTPMWQADESIPQSDAERGKIISEALSTQMQLIRKYEYSRQSRTYPNCVGDGKIGMVTDFFVSMLLNSFIMPNFAPMYTAKRTDTPKNM